jgi:hypothetical protein
MVSFDFYSESESFNWIVHAAVVGFAGTYNLEVEADFTVIGQANEASGWKGYSNSGYRFQRRSLGCCRN